MFSLWRKARRENSAASRLLGSTSLRFALHGWQRLLATEVSTLRFALVIYLPAQAQCTRSPLVAVAGITRITKD
ncbi:hypothetical protein, partial [Thiolapillus sp.]|uniref:hypothetical protein n=1 Tax=Thiolapillus sp. TaxID=2017437 RepID=UPI0025DF97C0